MELTSATEVDDEAREIDDDENKGRSEKEELKEYYLESNFHSGISACYNCDKHTLNFYKLLFKSHFAEVVTPPPELV